jgi:hypothetical protein
MLRLLSRAVTSADLQRWRLSLVLSQLLSHPSKSRERDNSRDSCPTVGGCSAAPPVADPSKSTPMDTEGRVF